MHPCEKPIFPCPVQRCAWVIWDPGCGIHRRVPSGKNETRRDLPEMCCQTFWLVVVIKIPTNKKHCSNWWITSIQIYGCCHYHWSIGLATLHRQQEATLEHPGARRIWARTPEIGSFPKLLSMEILNRVVFHGQVWEFSHLDLSMEIVHARKFQVTIIATAPKMISYFSQQLPTLVQDPPGFFQGAGKLAAMSSVKFSETSSP